MSLISEDNFGVNQIKPKEMDKLIDQLHKNFRAKIFLKDVCPACGSQEYTFAFDKYSFHYVECKACKSLYVQNGISKEDYSKYLKILEREIYSSISYKDYLEKLAEVSHFNFDLTLSRILDKDKLISVGYLGNKARLYKNYFESFDVVFDDVKEFKEKYDFIILDRCMEKSLNLKTFIGEVSRFLNDDGYLYISSRLGSGIDILTLWEDAKLYPLEHQNLLSIDGIRIMLKSNGFIIKELNTPGNLDVDNILGSESRNIPRFLKYLSGFEKEKALEDFRVFIQKSLLSSFAIVIAQKG